MKIIWILAALLAILVILTLTVSLICFFRIFFSPKRKIDPDSFDIPVGEIYEPYRESMVGWMKMTRTLPHRDIEIKSHDGLTLRGKYYEHQPGAPIEILMHGYRGSAERDMSGGVSRCHTLGRSALVINHRASGTSDGSVITFGRLERLDCLAWIKYIIDHIDRDAKIILTGISMGAATVMLTAAEEDLPPNVVGVLADCGYSSAEEIIKKVMREMKLPANLLYPFARLGGLLFGHFDVSKASPINAMKRARVPVLFIHGDSDAFVPHAMSVENFKACVTKKELVTVAGAGHGLCFPVNPEQYFEALKNFFDPLLGK